MSETLSRQLDAFMDGLLDRVDPAVARVIVEAAGAAAETGVLQEALRRGELAPEFCLPDQLGRTISLRDLLVRGPVVLTFFRGGWCPFCSLALRALNEAAPELQAAGASLVAISPQKSEQAAGAAARHGLRFPVLTDHGNEVARRYGLVWQLGPEHRAVYERLGHPLPAVNEAGDWTLPIPAGFVIAQDGRITYDHLDTRVTRRLEPRAALDAVRALAPAGRDDHWTINSGGAGRPGVPGP